MEAKDEALKILLRKRHSGRQIFEKLLEKGFESGDAEEAVEYYREKGYIDDADYARRFAADAVKIKGFGRARIERDLRQRGIGQCDIDNALSGVQFDVASQMIKKFPACTSLKEKNKIINHFLRKGFSLSEIHDAFGEIYEEF